ncbi:MAG: hypothetical protein LUD29_01060 [Clostridia bacterium]|nr:hypothetical protein [Clostridia bacterium]
MAEDEKVLEAEGNAPAPAEKQQPSKWKNFWRKQMVSLKRKPQRIGFWLFMITCVYYLFCLGTYSKGLGNNGFETDWVGLLVFVNVLCSVLAVVLYLYSFPKIKKYGSKVVKDVEFAKGIKVNFNTVMLSLLIVFCAAIIICNVYYYNIMNDAYLEEIATYPIMSEDQEATWNTILHTLDMSIAHIVLTGASLICGCMTYLFGKWFVKVDTSIKVESSAETMGQIDLVEDE